MNIPGFDVYAFHDRPDVLYAIRDFEVKSAAGVIKVIVELLVKVGCPEVILTQKRPKPPKFLINNYAEGLARPVAGSIARSLRDLLVSRPTADAMEGCAGAVAELSSSFGKVPVPAADLVARIPVIAAGKIRVRDKLGNVRSVNRANFELEPQGYGYAISTEHSLKIFPEKIEHAIRNFQ